MSVPSGRRGESDLLVHQKADELAKYTLHITENEKVFDSGWMPTTRIFGRSN